MLKIMELISSGRGDDMLDLVSEDFRFELPYGPAEMAGGMDKATWGPMQNQTFKMFSKFSLEPVAFHDQLDPDALVAEYRSDAVVAHNDKPYRNTYVGVFKFRDGKVVFWKEFHNPEIVTRAMT